MNKHCDGMAFLAMASYYQAGDMVPQDEKKAFECFVKASEMGNAHAMYAVAFSYMNGKAVPVDEEKAKVYFEMAARKGHVAALVRLTNIHRENVVVFSQYLRLAAEHGDEDAMESLKKMYRSSTDSTSNHNETCDCSFCNFHKNLLTKDDLAATIRAFHSAQEELRSDERDLAIEEFKIRQDATKS